MASALKLPHMMYGALWIEDFPRSVSGDFHSIAFSFSSSEGQVISDKTPLDYTAC